MIVTGQLILLEVALIRKTRRTFLSLLIVFANTFSSLQRSLKVSRSGSRGEGVVSCRFLIETGYQTLINAALREYLEGKAPKIEDALRRIVREELAASKSVV